MPGPVWGSERLTYTRHWGHRSLDLRHLPGGFLVTGLSKLRAAASQDITLLTHLAHCAAAIIFDEAHQAVAATYAFITEQLCKHKAAATRPYGYAGAYRKLFGGGLSTDQHVQPQKGVD